MTNVIPHGSVDYDIDFQKSDPYEEIIQKNIHHPFGFRGNISAAIGSRSDR
jgi:hypothetical protein